MADPRELGGLLWEREAERAYSKMAEIEEAAEWCRRNGPHKFEFLNKLRAILLEEEIQMAKLGLNEAIRVGAVKRVPTLSLLTPSQALRLLECYKRATANSLAMWRAKDIDEMDKIESDQRRKTTIAKIREQLRQRDSDANPPGTV